jgi:hypothetical protein
LNFELKSIGAVSGKGINQVFLPADMHGRDAHATGEADTMFW